MYVFCVCVYGGGGSQTSPQYYNQKSSLEVDNTGWLMVDKPLVLTKSLWWKN